MPIHNSPNLPNPEVIALKALGFLAQRLGLVGIELPLLDVAGRVSLPT